MRMIASELGICPLQLAVGFVKIVHVKLAHKRGLVGMGYVTAHKHKHVTSAKAIYDQRWA